MSANISDQKFLRLALAISLFILAAPENNEPVPAPVVDNAEPVITQQIVDDEYDRLYRLIKTRKAAAEAKGKNLLVLIGENHHQYRALMEENLVVDIGSRMGMKDVVHEDDRRSIKSESRMVQRVMQYNTRHVISEIPGLRQCPDDFRKKFLLAGLYAQQDVSKPKLVYNSTLLIYNEFSKGMRISEGDPKWAERGKIYKKDKNLGGELCAPKFENFMCKALRKVAAEHFTMAIYGAAHVITLDRFLVKDKKVSVLLIDTESDDLSWADGFDAARIRAAKEVAYHSGLRNLNILSREAPLHVYSLGLIASIKHQQKSGEISAAGANVRLNMLDKVISTEQKIRHKHGARFSFRP